MPSTSVSFLCTLLLFSSLFSSCYSSSWRYWVDSSCTSRFGNHVDRAVREAVSWSRRSVELMREQNAYYMWAISFIFPYNYHVFVNEIFQGPEDGPEDDDDSDDEDPNIYLNSLPYPGIKNLLAGASRGSSEVRYYCDNDAFGSCRRWQIVPDDPNDDWEDRNSQQPVEEQLWYDTTNFIYRENDSKGCADPGDPWQAASYHNPVDELDTYPTNPGESTSRMVTTFCDQTLRHRPYLLRGISNADIRRKTDMDDFKDLLSLVALHELMHHPKWDKADNLGEQTIIGWDDSVMAATANFMNCKELADCYAMAGLLAALYDRGLQLSRNIEEARQGKLIYVGTSQ